MGGALKGLKVLDFTWAAAGPLATLYLANFGATVIKVESRKRLDVARVSEPFKGGKVDPNKAGLFVHFNASKHSITLDLTHHRGKELALRLGRWADAVVENFRPGVMKRLGLGYEDLRQVNPGIIMVSASILGEQGAEPGVGGFGITAAALSGHYYLTGWPDGEPTTPASIAYADTVQPLFTVAALLSALDYRRRTGKGQHIDIAQIEPMALFLSPAVLDYQLNSRPPFRQGNRHPQAAPHGVFPCQGEDRWIAIAVFTDEEWQGLCQAMGNPAWSAEPCFATAPGRKANEEELERLVGEWTRGQVAEAAMKGLQACGVAAGAVQDASDLMDCPQLKERGSFLTLPHAEMGPSLHPAPPVHLSRTPGQVRPAPVLGQDNDWVYTQVLGLSDEEYATLIAEGVLE